MDDRLLFDSRASMISVIKSGETEANLDLFTPFLLDSDVPSDWYIVRVFLTINNVTSIAPRYYVLGNQLYITEPSTPGKTKIQWRIYGKS